MGTICERNEDNDDDDLEQLMEKNKKEHQISMQKKKNRKKIEKQILNKHGIHPDVIIDEERSQISDYSLLQPSIFQNRTASNRDTLFNILNQSNKKFDERKFQQLFFDQETIKLSNLNTQRFLHSHAIKYETGSKQQEVCCCQERDCQYDIWTIFKIPKSSKDSQDNIIRENDIIVFQHNLTKKYLSSNIVHKSSSLQLQEVSCQLLADTSCEWTIEIVKNKKELSQQKLPMHQFSKNKEISESSLVYLIHIESQNYLHTEPKVRAIQPNHREVACCNNRDNNDIWTISFGYDDKSSILHSFLNQVPNSQSQMSQLTNNTTNK